MVRREPDCQNMRNLKYNMWFESSEDPPETHKTTVLGRKNIFDEIELQTLNAR